MNFNSNPNDFMDDDLREYLAMYGDESEQAAAKNSGASSNTTEILDSNGNTLNNGDSVFLIKDLDVKGSSLNLKRGTVIKNIKIVPDEAEAVQCRIGKATIMLNPAYLKKK